MISVKAKAKVKKLAWVTASRTVMNWIQGSTLKAIKRELLTYPPKSGFKSTLVEISLLNSKNNCKKLSFQSICQAWIDLSTCTRSTAVIMRKQSRIYKETCIACRMTFKDWSYTCRQGIEAKYIIGQKLKILFYRSIVRIHALMKCKCYRKLKDLSKLSLENISGN